MLKILEKFNPKLLDLSKVLDNFSRAELRRYAKNHGIRRGQNKKDTIRNIINADVKIKVMIQLCE